MAKNKLLSKSKGFVVERLENISKSLFKKYFDLITELIGTSPGIYALYDGGELYYVGKSTNLKKRVRSHLRDRHLANWTHFSLFLIKKEEYINEIESLLVRIANPKGNRVKPKGKAGTSMLKKLKIMVKEKQGEEFDKMFGDSTRKKLNTHISNKKQDLKTLIGRKATLFKTYKGREYKAVLYKNGAIKFNGIMYKTPTAAAKAVTRRKAISGWDFWYIRNKNGDWIRLSDYEN